MTGEETPRPRTFVESAASAQAGQGPPPTREVFDKGKLVARRGRKARGLSSDSPAADLLSTLCCPRGSLDTEVTHAAGHPSAGPQRTLPAGRHDGRGTVRQHRYGDGL